MRSSGSGETVGGRIRATGENGASVAVTDRMTLDLRRLIDRSGRWLLNYRPQTACGGAPKSTGSQRKSPSLTPRMSEWLRWR